MNKFIPHEIPLYFNGVFYEKLIDCERLNFYALNLYVDIYKNNVINWVITPTNIIKTIVPINTITDFNNLSTIMGFGNLLSTKEDYYLHKTIIEGLILTNNGILIDEEPILIFNHKQETCEDVSKSLSNDVSKSLYKQLMFDIHTLGYNINKTIDKNKNRTFNETLFKIQNRLDIPKQND